MSPIPTLLPRVRASLALLAERLLAVAEQIRGMAVALIRAGRTCARVVWFYSQARQRHRHQDLVDAVLTAASLQPVRRRPVRSDCERVWKSVPYPQGRAEYRPAR